MAKMPFMKGKKKPKGGMPEGEMVMPPMKKKGKAKKKMGPKDKRY